MLNGDIFSELFLSNLDEKITSAGYEKARIFQAWIGLDSINFLVQKPPKRRISADQAVKIFPPRW